MDEQTVFVSYSHKDEPWKDRLVTQLRVLVEEGVLDVWQDRQIEGGDDWRAEIVSAVNAATVAVLMISPNFLTSKFILGEEVPHLLKRRQREGLRIIPLIVRPCAWQRVKWLSRIQSRPKDGRPLSGANDHQVEADLAALAEEVAALLDRAPRGRGKASKFLPLTSERVALSKLPSTDPRLFGRKNELTLLSRAWRDDKTNILTLIAWGGVGKTALVKAWLNRMQRDHYRGAERVFGWTFYSRGAAEDRQASADRFIAAALTWFGDEDPQAGSPWDKGRRLADLVRRQRTLLYLDGLEPLQHPPGRGMPVGRLKDQALAALLGELCWQNPGLCIITSRLEVADIRDCVGASVRQVALEHLPTEAGAKLLAALGVQGTPAELAAVAAEYAGHALALNLLGEYVAGAHDGDVRKRDRVPALTGAPRQGDHARRVMRAYEDWFKEQPELSILQLVGLFEGPAEPEAVDAVLAEPAIGGLTDGLIELPEADWNLAVGRLRAVRLLAPADPARPGELDCHPLVREHFADALRKKRRGAAWREAHSRLYEHYRKLPAKEHPDTLEGMAPLYAAVAHGCQAGRHQEALAEVYWRRIQRGNESFSTKKLGAFGSELAALAGFFDPPWSQVVDGLGERDRAFVLNEAGFDLRAQGRLAEAAQPTEAGLEARVTLEDWKNAARQASNLSELYLTMGEVANAIGFGERSVQHAERSDDTFQRMGKRTTMADALHQAGRTDKALDLFREAETMQAEGQPHYPLLYSIRGYRYCDLLLGRGECEEAQRRGKKMLEWRVRTDSLLDIALDHLSLARSGLQIAVRDGTGDFDEAARELDEAVYGLRRSGVQEFVARALLARAELGRVRGDLDAAWRDVNEAQGIAERGGMRLFVADCHLEAARLHLAAGERDEARERLDAAEELIDETGYHRRDAEVHLARARLALLASDMAEAQRRLDQAARRVEEMGMHCWDGELADLRAQLAG